MPKMSQRNYTGMRIRNLKMVNLIEFEMELGLEKGFRFLSEKELIDL